MKEAETFVFGVEKDQAGERIDRFVAESREELSRSQVQKLIGDGAVVVNGSPVKSNYKLREGDLVTVCVPKPEELQVEAEDIPLDVLYEDEHLIVINKPQGMVVHPAPGHSSGTLVNALLFHCQGQLSGINGMLRPGIVHRIDRDTSGVLVAAKSDLAHRSLAAQLADHSITRKYWAVAMNNIKEDTLTIDRPLGRNSKDRKKMAIVPGGRRAVTHIRVLERLGRFCLVEAQLETGRTHQIRVHLSSIGHPLLGDVVYGSEKQPFSLQGQVLHAKVLGFLHPATGEYMEFETPLPPYFEALLQKLRQKA